MFFSAAFVVLRLVTEEDELLQHCLQELQFGVAYYMPSLALVVGTAFRVPRN